MDNLGTAEAATKEQLSVLKHKQTWVMSFLYIGTFGSFIGYSAAMPLLIKLNFWRQPVPDRRRHRHQLRLLRVPRRPGRLDGPPARRLAGRPVRRREGHARPRSAAWSLGTLGVLWTLSLLEPCPRRPPRGAGRDQGRPGAFEFPPAVVNAVDANCDIFPLFLGMFLLIFLFTGIGNGSTYKMIPAIFKTEAERATDAGHPGAGARRLSRPPRRRPPRSASSARSVRIGGFLIPITFGSPWITDPLDATKTAFMVFTGFYVVCALVTWAVYLRRPAEAKAATSYAGVGI